MPRIYNRFSFCRDGLVCRPGLWGSTPARCRSGAPVSAIAPRSQSPQPRWYPSLIPPRQSCRAPPTRDCRFVSKRMEVCRNCRCLESDFAHSRRKSIPPIAGRCERYAQNHRTACRARMRKASLLAGHEISRRARSARCRVISRAERARARAARLRSSG